MIMICVIKSTDVFRLDPTACGSGRRRRRSLYSDNDSPPKGSKMVKVRIKQPIQIIRPGLYETLKGVYK